jgi:hypothetical protein
MRHVVLLGDSVFDNARYVPDRPPVIQQVRHALGGDWRATLLAVDGHITVDVARQLENLPPDATHLVVSVGGNDALQSSAVLNEPVSTVAEALGLLHEVLRGFTDTYRAMLKLVAQVGKPASVCTIYDAIPGLGPAEQTALACFNEVILREAIRTANPIIDLRLVCDHASDYSHLSPIEPSVLGGAKIARLIAQFSTTYELGARQITIYR